MGYEVLRIFLGVITKGVISMHFRVVSKGQGTELAIFFGLVVKFQLFGGGGLDTPDNFGGVNSRC